LNHLEIEKIILFGSVTRGKDSDIDVLIITKNINNDLKISDDIYGKVMDILLETSECLSTKMVLIEHYQSHLNSYFYLNVGNEGILIG
jgi:predicted nucleotidyltransferase